MTKLSQSRTGQPDRSQAGVSRRSSAAKRIDSGIAAVSADVAAVAADVAAIPPFSVFTAAADGFAPLTGGVGSTFFLCADGSWAVPGSGGGGLTHPQALARGLGA